MSTLDALDQSLLGPSFDVTSDEVVAIKAEDLQGESGFDFTKHFFEPQPGNTYLVKFLPNPRDAKALVTHRSLYRSLPDPERRGKTFHYVSSGNSKTCPVLQLFFDLYELKKNGDAVATKKIDKYLGRTNQACTLVQILSSPVKEEIGQIRLFIYSTFGPNATIANLLNQRINPTKDQIAAGFEREDVFNIFESSVLSIVCKEETYDGRKGREYSMSVWAPKKRGAIAVLPDGTTREFQKSDIVDGKLSEEVKPFFEAFKATIMNPDYDVYTHFAYKDLNDPRLDDATKAYLETINKKVETVVPVLRDGTLAEIATLGKVEKNESGDKPESKVLEDSIPDELKDMVETESASTQAPANALSAEDQELQSILE